MHFILPKEEWAKVFKGFCIAMAGAGLACLTQWSLDTDLGIYDVFVGGAIATLVNYFHKATGEPVSKAAGSLVGMPPKE